MEAPSSGDFGCPPRQTVEHGRDGNREHGWRRTCRRSANAARLQPGVRRASASARPAGGPTEGTGRVRPRYGPARPSARNRRSRRGRGNARAAIAVEPGTRGPPGRAVRHTKPADQGYGREPITETLRVARELGADYAYLVTSEHDRLAQRLYQAAGFRRTDGEGGPLMLAYEREL